MRPYDRGTPPPPSPCLSVLFAFLMLWMAALGHLTHREALWPIEQLDHTMEDAP